MVIWYMVFDVVSVRAIRHILTDYSLCLNVTIDTVFSSKKYRYDAGWLSSMFIADV